MKCPTCKGKGEVPTADIGIVKSVVAELKRVAGTNYKHNTRTTLEVIRARLNEGWVAEDFARVIKTKCEEWLRDPRMKPYLRPSTLFGPKFEGYLNQSTKAPKQKVKFVY